MPLTPRSRNVGIGIGKSSGARGICFNSKNEITWLLIAYKKAKFDNLSTSYIA